MKYVVYKYLGDTNLLPPEEKGYHKNSRGMKDHLLVNKLVMDMAKCKKKLTHGLD